MNKADPNRIQYVAKTGRDSDSWHTPKHVVEMVREVLGSIDYDPFSCDEAQRTVRAKFYNTLDFSVYGPQPENLDWHTMFLNPPYGRGTYAKAVKKGLELALSGGKSTIALTNNSTETKATQALLAASCSICLPNKRIAFTNDDGKAISSNTRGQIIYLITDSISVKEKFKEVFCSFGLIFDPSL